MPYRRSDWHEHLVEVWGEYKSTRAAVDRLRAAIVSTPRKSGVSSSFLPERMNRHRIRARKKLSVTNEGGEGMIRE